MRYPQLLQDIRMGDIPHKLAEATGKRLLSYCAFGERIAMALQAAQGAGIIRARQIDGGTDARKKIGGVPRPSDHSVRASERVKTCYVLSVRGIMASDDPLPTGTAPFTALPPRESSSEAAF